MIIIQDIPNSLYNTVLSKLITAWELPWKYEAQWDSGEKSLLNRYRFVSLQIINNEVVVMLYNGLQVNPENTFITVGEFLNADSVDELFITTLL